MAAQPRAARHVRGERPRPAPAQVLVAAACLTVALCMGTVGHAQRGAAPDMPVEQVVVGDKGHAVTAGPGNRLERFPIEVVAVQWEGGAGFPLVLVRAGGEFIAAAGGVAAGMSGSPVYVSTEAGDALLGAIGYVFPRADHDLALVTPIAVMRRALPGRMPPFVDVPGVGRAVPAATPVLMTGVSTRAAALLAPLFRDERVAPLVAQGGGTGPASPSGAPGAADELGPGSALAVALAWGDVNIQAVGTVTAVEDGELLAFGHPFLGLGRVAYPVVPAEVTAIVASADVPFKLANAGGPILGTVEQDRPGAIAGRLGVEPPAILVELSLLGIGPSTSYSFSVPADDRLYPPVVGTGVLALLDRYLSATTGGYAEVAWEIALGSGERVNVLEQTNDATDIGYRAAVLAFSPLALLADNRFGESDVTRVSLAIRLDERQRVATLEEAVAEETTVAAGENAIVHLRLQPYRQPAIVRNVSVPIPADMEGELTLLIRGGDVPRDTGDAHVDEQEVDRPRSYPELLDALRQQVQASELVVEVVTPDGDVLRLLRTPFAFVVDGNERVTLEVVIAEDTDEGTGADGAENVGEDGDAAGGAGEEGAEDDER